MLKDRYNLQNDSNSSENSALPDKYFTVCYIIGLL